MSKISTLTIRRPDDWHVHLRDGEMLKAVVNATAKQFARAIVMPNLTPPVTTTKRAAAYRDRITAAINPALNFTPLMTAYLTDDTDGSDLKAGHADGVLTAAKLYPANATTNSSHGVTDMKAIAGALEAMQACGMPLLLHGEVTHSDVDIFDREAVFIDKVLKDVVKDFPDLKIVFEHITTSEAVDFVNASGPNIAATITPHHLEYNRNAIFQGGIRPHYYCLPIAKRERHRLSLRKAATSGSAKFFLGTDTAPHEKGAKESACGCAGVYNAPVAMESYTMTFEQEGALDKLEGFASEHGPRFYGLPLNTEKVTLVRKDNLIAETMNAADSCIIPFHAGETLPWTFETA